MATRLSGLNLDENFDFVVSSSGDLDSVSRIDELQKDLSGAITAIVESQFTGSVLTPNVATTLESLLRSRVEFDDRVNRVRRIDITESLGATIADVYISVDTIYGTIDVEAN